MKKIFYYTDLMPFLSDGDKAISKIKRNFEIFREYKDEILLVWHPYSRIEEFLKLNNSKHLEEYLQLVEYFKNSDLGCFDEETDLSKPAEVCDAYYGDYSDSISFFTKNIKPVMIQNIDI